MVFNPTELPQAAPLSVREAASVTGTLGTICWQRVLAYQTAQPKLINVDFTRPSFKDALAKPGVQIIAEVKRASPSLGAIANLQPDSAARAYAAGGAAALSVLTEPKHFGGKLQHLADVAKAVNLPLLRKDFTVHPWQLFEAKAAGASAVLLIVAALKDKLADYLALAKALGLDALVEVHDEEELARALQTDAEVIGVNNRNLKTLEIHLDNAPKLIERAREQGFKGLTVAESGYNHAAELADVHHLADAVLVGSSLAGSGDLEAAVATFRRELDAL